MTAVSTLFGISLSALAATAAQPESVPGPQPAVPNAASLEPFSGAWRIVEIAPDGTRKIVEESTDRLERAAVDGRDVWRQVQHETAGNSGISDVVVLTDARSFEPLLSEWRDTRDGSFRTVRHSGTVAELSCGGHLCPPDLIPPPSGPAKRRTEMAEQAFDYWGGSYGLLFATLPLAEDYSAMVPVFHPMRGLIRLKVEVTGIESVGAGGGRTVSAFRVVTPLTGWVYHISLKPPYWLRLEYRKPDGTIQITERI